MMMPQLPRTLVIFAFQVPLTLLVSANDRQKLEKVVKEKKDDFGKIHKVFITQSEQFALVNKYYKALAKDVPKSGQSQTDFGKVLLGMDLPATLAIMDKATKRLQNAGNKDALTQQEDQNKEEVTALTKKIVALVKKDGQFADVEKCQLLTKSIGDLQETQGSRNIGAVVNSSICTAAAIQTKVFPIRSRACPPTKKIEDCGEGSMTSIEDWIPEFNFGEIIETISSTADGSNEVTVSQWIKVGFNFLVDIVEAVDKYVNHGQKREKEWDLALSILKSVEGLTLQIAKQVETGDYEAEKKLAEECKTQATAGEIEKSIEEKCALLKRKYGAEYFEKNPSIEVYQRNMQVVGNLLKYMSARLNVTMAARKKSEDAYKLAVANFEKFVDVANNQNAENKDSKEDDGSLNNFLEKIKKDFDQATTDYGSLSERKKSEEALARYRRGLSNTQKDKFDDWIEKFDKLPLPQGSRLLSATSTNHVVVKKDEKALAAFKKDLSANETDYRVKDLVLKYIVAEQESRPTTELSLTLQANVSATDDWITDLANGSQPIFGNAMTGTVFTLLFIGMSAL